MNHCASSTKCHLHKSCVGSSVGELRDVPDSIPETNVFPSPLNNLLTINIFL